MVEANIREYFEGVCDHFLVPVTEVLEMLQRVFGKDNGYSQILNSPSVAYHCCWAPLLSWGVLLSTGATLSSSYHFFIVGITIKPFSSIHLVH